MRNELPWSKRSEQSVLGAALIQPDVLGWLELDTEHFHQSAHRAIYGAMRAVYDRGAALDPVTLEAELERQGALEGVGGLEYLSEVAQTVPTADNVEFYARDLDDYRTTREVMGHAAGILAEARGQVPGGKEPLRGEELLDQALERLGRVRRTRHNERTDFSAAVRDFIRRVGPEVEDRAQGLEGKTLMATGVEKLDREIGGLPMATLSGLAGRYGSGKSALAFQVALNVARRGRRVAYFTAEDPRERMVERGFARDARVNLERINQRDLNAVELADVYRAADGLDVEELHVLHAHGWGVREIVRESMVLEPELVVVDYAQELEPPEKGLKKHDAIEENARRLAQYAGKSGAAVLLLSQLNKGQKAENRRPTDEDLRYGEGVSMKAKLLMLLHDPQIRGEKNARQALIPKRNQGESNLVIDLYFDGAHCEFR